MAIEIATAYVQIVPSMKGVGTAIVDAFAGAAGKAGSQAGNTAGETMRGGLAAKTGAIMGAVSTITSKVGNVIGSSLSSAISRADQMNNFPKVMRNLGYSSEDAAASIKKISQSLDGLPTTSSAMTGMVQQLAPLTSSLDEATNISLAFNNAMLAGGASTMEQENALEQYTQMLSAGKVDMQAWRSIQAAMPGQLNQLAQALLGAGKNGNDLYDAMKDGTVSFDQFNKAVVKLNSDGFGQYASFAQQAKDATQGIGTAMENVKNRVAKAVQKVIEAIGTEQIAGAINSFSSQFGRIGDIAADATTAAKNSIADLWNKIGQTDAINGLKTRWAGLVATFRNIDWSGLLPGKDIEGLQWTVASVTADIIDRIGDLLGIAGRCASGIAELARGFTQTAAIASFTDLIGSVADLIRDLWSAIGDVIGRMTGLAGAAGSATTFGQAIGNAFRTAIDAIRPVINLLDDLANWCGQHSGAVATALSAIGGAFAAFKTAQAVTAAVAHLKDLGAAASLASEAMKGGKGAFAAISESISALGTDAGGITSAIGGLAGRLAGLQASAVKAGGGIKGLSAALGLGPWGLVAAGIAAVVAGLVWFFTQTKTGQQLWASFTSFLSSAWQSAVSTVVSIGQTIASFFTSTLPSAIQSVGQWFQQLPGSIASWLAGAASAVAAWAVSLGQSALQAGQQFITNLANAIMNLPETIAYWLGYTVTTIVLYAAAFGAQALQMGSQFVQNVGSFLTQLPGNIASWLASALAAIGAWAIQTAMQAMQAGSQFLANLGNFLSQLPGRVQAWVAGALAAVAGWAIQMAARGLQAGSQFVQNTGTFLSQLPARVGTWLLSTIARAASFASQMGSKAVQASTQFASNLVNGLTSLPGRMLSIGANIVDGIVNGIQSKIGSVASSLLSGVNNAIDAVKSKLGINSPSRLMRDEVGVMIGRGLALGIDDSAAVVDRSMDSLVSSMSLDGTDWSKTGRLNVTGVAGGTTEGDIRELIAAVESLHDDLGPIIARYAPTISDRDFARKVRNAIA
ncbi:tape measure domain-containing protein [Bifidobacterium sp. DSM 109960]|uniref:Tape measure domain-containing protein n=1 Tax=Bifidobacterium erythrocebi TaxID=2675325 RepID=A0A7Y0ETS1_9BIFI|nr:MULTISPECIES: tape measure protein [Bifidobacterium]MBW3095340.1 tape measure protein [Bifidobacterium pongonis]NMM96284.1 tape measure domain-containing protein [Bifidobacterium sp. DSM 109960]